MPIFALWAKMAKPTATAMGEPEGWWPRTTGLPLPGRARSSAGQSSGLIIRWSVVRVHPGPLSAAFSGGKCVWPPFRRPSSPRVGVSPAAEQECGLELSAAASPPLRLTSRLRRRKRPVLRSSLWHGRVLSVRRRESRGRPLLQRLRRARSAHRRPSGASSRRCVLRHVRVDGDGRAGRCGDGAGPDALVLPRDARGARAPRRDGGEVRRRRGAGGVRGAEAHEDDALRACRAALEMQARLAR